MALLLDFECPKVKDAIARAMDAGCLTFSDLDDLVGQSHAAVSPDDLEDTMAALNDMGINIVDDGVDPTTGEVDPAQQQLDDEAFAAGMKAWIAAGNNMPQLTGEGWAALARVDERERKARDDKG